MLILQLLGDPAVAHKLFGIWNVDGYDDRLVDLIAYMRFHGFWSRSFGRVFLFFRIQRPPLSGWSTMVRQVALTYTATIIVALAAQKAGRLDLIRSPKRVLAHTWEGF